MINRIYTRKRIREVLKEVPVNALQIFNTPYYIVSRLDALKIRKERDMNEIFIREMFEEARKAANRARYLVF